MPHTVFESCVPRPDVAAGTTKDEQFAADLAQVIAGTAPDEYRVPAVFFRNSYPTRGMKELLKAVGTRLSGQGGEIGSVFRLDTQYGGGKTHALIALVHAMRGLAGKGPVIYLENHDHSTITLSAGGRGLWYRLQPYIIALYTTPGAVMVANGQEFGRVEFLWESDGDKAPSEKRVQPRPLRWAEADDGPGRALRDKYSRLAKLRAGHPGLRTSNFYPDFYDEAWAHFSPEGYGVDVDKQVVIYHRWGTAADNRTERFIVLLNFSEYDQWVDLPFSTNGDWDDLLNGFRVNVSDYWIRNFRVSSYWGHVFYQKA